MDRLDSSRRLAHASSRADLKGKVCASQRETGGNNYLAGSPFLNALQWVPRAPKIDGERITMPDLYGTINQILDGTRKGIRDIPQTVENLKAFYLQLSLEDRGRFFEPLWAAILSEPLNPMEESPSGKLSQNVVGVVIQAWGKFGNPEELCPRVFALLRWNDPRSMETWARVVCPQFEVALVDNADRFLKPALDAIKAQAVIFTYERDSGLTRGNFPDALVDAAAHLASVVELIEFERFERTLRQTVAIPKTEPQDLNALLVSLGFDSSIASAMKEVRSFLESPNAFSAKIAGDLLRSTVDTTHRQLVKALANIKQKPYTGKELDGDRRAYMREVGFITLAEEKFFSSIYSLISEEASHKLDAPKETILVMQQAVQGYLLLLLRRLGDLSK